MHMNLIEIPFLIHRVYYGVCSYNSFNSSWKTFHKVFMGIFDHSSKSTFVRSDTDVGLECLAHSLRSNSSQRCAIRLRSGLVVGQSSCSTPNSLNHAFMDLALCTGAQSFWCTSLNCSHKVGSMKLSKMSCYDETLRVPFTGRDWNN